MTSGFQQQAPLHNAFTRSAPQPQSGQQADKSLTAVKENRTFQPKPRSY